MLEALAKLLKALNSESAPEQISAAFVLGMAMGLTPPFTLHNLLLLLFVCLLRINLSGFLLAWGLFSALAFLLDPLFHLIGQALLTAPTFTPLWTTLYSQPFWRLTDFNNTVVLGSACLSVLAAAPLFVLFQILIIRYRRHLLKWIEKTRIGQFIKASKLFQIYQTLTGNQGTT